MYCCPARSPPGTPAPPPPSPGLGACVRARTARSARSRLQQVTPSLWYQVKGLMDNTSLNNMCFYTAGAALIVFGACLCVASAARRPLAPVPPCSFVCALHRVRFPTIGAAVGASRMPCASCTRTCTHTTVMAYETASPNDRIRE